MRILVVEDEYAIASSIRNHLMRAGYSCEIAGDGAAAITKMKSKKHGDYDLALIDIMLPEIDGYGVLEEACSRNIPSIIVTARGQLPERVMGLRQGADDYIVKPFASEELLARIEAVFRRTGCLENELMVHDIHIDMRSRCIFCNGNPIALKPKEYDLLLYLVRNKNIVLDRDRILDAIWGYEYMDCIRTVDVHVCRLRRKLGWDEHIVTVPTVGYRLDA